MTTTTSPPPYLSLVPALPGSWAAADEVEVDDVEDDDSVDELEITALVAAEVAGVLGRASDEVTAVAPLTLALALSLCMERHDADVAALVDAMQLLRRAVLAVSCLDSASEPVPLVTGDLRSAALGLAEYLRGLISRAAQASAAAPEMVARAAAMQLA